MDSKNWTPPAFAQTIVEKYISAQSNVFLIYGNTKDIYQVSPGKYVGLQEFLSEALIKPNRPGSPKIVVLYDPVNGINFPNGLDKILIGEIIGKDRLEKVLQSARQDVVTACSALRELVGINVLVDGNSGEKIRKDFAIIMKYGETIAPPGSEAVLDSDRLKVITLENWFSDNLFVSSPDIVFMICETLSGINSRIVDLPYSSAIKIDRPKLEERIEFLTELVRKETLDTDVSVGQLAFAGAGLTLLSLQQIVKQAKFKTLELSPSLIFDKMKEIIEKELEGHIEFPSLSYGFESVIGATKLLKKLNELKLCIQSAEPDLMPIGILVPGANGVGKTFIYKAFAKECGWIAVVLKNIRGPYVGQTEKNWEKIRSVLEAMGNVMVLYDEADTEIGGRSAQTHDVDRRLFGNILKMMSDPGNRGKLIWIIITARPDRLEPDIKRSGRAGEHLPVFDLEGDERDEFITSVLMRAGIALETFSESQIADFRGFTQDFFPADFDHVLTELRRKKLIMGELQPETVLDVLRDFIPSDIARQREYQELLAVIECTSRELLPDKYAELSKEDIYLRLRYIKDSMVEVSC